MRRLVSFARVAVAAALIGFAGCAHAPDGKPAVCDGRHRRPANPYGSVLPVFPGPPNAISAPPGAEAPPLQAPGPMSAVDLRSLAPCGSGT